MGSSSSTLAENVVNSHIQAVTSIMNSSTQECSANNVQVSSIIVSVEDSEVSGDVFFGGNVTQTSQVSATCQAEFSANNCITTALQQTIQQTADAIAKGGLTRSDVESANSTYLLTQLTNNIYNSYNQICFANTFQKSLYLASVKGSTVSGNIIVSPEIDQVASSAVDCALSTDTVSQSRTEITQYLSQKAEAKNVGIITPAVIVAVVLGITVILAVLAKKLKPGTIVFLFIFLSLLGVGIYFLIAWLVGLPPFPPEEETCFIDPTITDGRECLIAVEEELDRENEANILTDLYPEFCEYGTIPLDVNPSGICREKLSYYGYNQNTFYSFCNKGQKEGTLDPEGLPCVCYDGAISNDGTCLLSYV